MSDTVIASAIGVAGVFAGSVVTWLGTRGKLRQDGALSQEQLNEQQRQSDLNLIIATLQTQVRELREELRAVKEEARVYLTEREQLRGEVGRLRQRVEELERHGAGTP